MKVTFTCYGKDEKGNFVELKLTAENDPSSNLEFFNFCKLCRERNLTDVGLRYSFEDNKDIHIFTFFHPNNEPRKTFLDWLKSLF